MSERTSDKSLTVEDGEIYYMALSIMGIMVINEKGDAKGGFMVG